MTPDTLIRKYGDNLLLISEGGATQTSWAEVLYSEKLFFDRCIHRDKYRLCYWDHENEEYKDLAWAETELSKDEFKQLGQEIIDKGLRDIAAIIATEVPPTEEFGTPEARLARLSDLTQEACHRLWTMVRASEAHYQAFVSRPS